MNLPPTIGFAAPRGTGKTTLVEQVIRELTQRGLRVAALKHGHHDAQPDQPGKDSYRFGHAGARTVLFASSKRWFQIQETDREPTLVEHLQRLANHDLIIVEGFKIEDHEKIVVHRRATGKPSLHGQLSRVVAVATDDDTLDTDLPIIPLNDPVAVAGFLVEHTGLSP
jgi:molybdopterin-guanine dinucleotide biosynthesis protein MobB